MRQIAVLAVIFVALALANSFSVGAAELTPTISRPICSVPINLVHNRVVLPGKINGSKSLSFHVDTGYGIDMIHPDLIEPLGLKRAGRLTIVGIAGEERASTYSGAVFDFGGATYAPRRVASLPSEAQRWRRRDGILGADFFRRFVVEIDPLKNKLSLYEPDSFKYSGDGEIVPLHFAADTPIVDATVVLPKEVTVQSRFEIDTGCDDALCLGREFVERNHLLTLADEDTQGVKRGVGGSARVRHGTLAQLQIGHVKLNQPSANFFTEGSPAGEGLAGHIGMGALHHWRMVFDYARQRMILIESR